MSSKKKYTTVGLSLDVFEKLQEEANRDHRSQGVMVEIILRERYKLPWERGMEKSDANKS